MGALEPLPEPEATRLTELEGKVGSARATYLRLGCEALYEIHRDRLYRASHSSFDDYCLDRWDISSSTAYRMVDQGKARALGETPKSQTRRSASPTRETLPSGTQQLTLFIPAALKAPDVDRIIVTAGNQTATVLAHSSSAEALRRTAAQCLAALDLLGEHGPERNRSAAPEQPEPTPGRKAPAPSGFSRRSGNLTRREVTPNFKPGKGAKR